MYIVTYETEQQGFVIVETEDELRKEIQNICGFDSDCKVYEIVEMML